jgi:hypothetical protein
MTDEPTGLDDLIRYVNAQHPDDDPLVHLSDAVLAAQRLDDLADQLIGHFVDQARRSGAPWSAIGEAMGVSKQAAQKRFVPSLPGLDLPDGSLNRFTPRARNTLAAAMREAKAMGSRKVETEHLLLGLISEPEGVAAKAIVALGVTLEQIRARVGAARVVDSTAAPERIPFTPPARKVLELSLREALGLGHNYIGTEHLLLGILAEAKGDGGKVLKHLGITMERAQDQIRKALDEMMAARAQGQ